MLALFSDNAASTAVGIILFGGIVSTLYSILAFGSLAGKFLREERAREARKNKEKNTNGFTGTFNLPVSFNTVM